MARMFRLHDVNPEEGEPFDIGYFPEKDHALTVKDDYERVGYEGELEVDEVVLFTPHEFPYALIATTPEDGGGDGMDGTITAVFSDLEMLTDLERQLHDSADPNADYFIEFLDRRGMPNG